MLLVALKLGGGWVSCAVGHALVAVDEDAVLLAGDLLLQGHAVVLQVLEGVLCHVQLVLQGVDGLLDLGHLAHQTAHTRAQHVDGFYTQQFTNIL